MAIWDLYLRNYFWIIFIILLVSMLDDVMNTQTQEALKMAIELLESPHITEQRINQVVQACKEALEQPAQHKWSEDGERCVKCGDKDWMGGSCSVADEQPSQEPVAFDCKNCHACLKGVKGETGYPITMTRMIVCPDCGNKRCPKATDHRHFCTNSNDTNQAGSIYNTHPAPSWQGLSDDEIQKIADETDKVFATSIFWVNAFARAIEQALKEKNT